jgi:aryl carrier-like protein
MGQPAQCSHCGKPLVVTIEVDDGPILDRLDRIEKLLHTVIKKENKLMTDQEHLDADVQALGAGLDEIVAEIDALKAQHPAVDFTALDAVVARVQGVAADNAPPPADEPAPDAGTEAPAE